MATTTRLVQWSFFLFQCCPLVISYKISTVDTPGVCNETIYLEEGDKSAAILRLTTQDFYDFSPFNCFVTFKAPQHSWSGLIGVLEEVDLRRYEDTSDHHLAQNQCVDFIKVFLNGGPPEDKQCGSWSVNGAEKLSHLGIRRSLFGYCPNPPVTGSIIRCSISELKVQISVGKNDFSSLRGGKPWGPHRGFTFVVTAYRYSFGESGCLEGLRSCGKTDYHGYQHHCVHESLWCDHHINCGQPKNNDELLCHNDEMLNGLMTVMIGPWIGAALLMVMILAGVLYWRRARPPLPQGPPQTQDHNSYAESYEVSSTMSSAHHMAIQVRVVCNSGHGIHTPRTSPWQGADLPPSYDSLFPHGPPPQKSTITTTTASSAASFNISTTSLVSASIGSNNNIPPGPSGYFSNTTQTSSIVIPINAICNNLGSSAVSSASFSTTTFTNTVASLTPTITNTTTSTTTVASVRASPAALASISVTSVSLAGPPDETSNHNNKDTDSINPSQDNISSSSSRAPTPNNCIKSDVKEEPSYMAEATPPLVEPEDTNITPCNSAGETPASIDTQLPYIFQEATQSNVNTVSDVQSSIALQYCDKTSISPTSKIASQDTETAFVTAGAMSLPCTLFSSCKEQNIGVHQHCELSVMPNHDSEEMERVNLDIPKNNEVEPYADIHIPSSYLKEEELDEVTIPSILHEEEKDDEDDTLERSSDINQALDKDNESLL